MKKQIVFIALLLIFTVSLSAKKRFAASAFWLNPSQWSLGQMMFGTQNPIGMSNTYGKIVSGDVFQWRYLKRNPYEGIPVFKQNVLNPAHFTQNVAGPYFTTGPDVSKAYITGPASVQGFRLAFLGYADINEVVFTDFTGGIQGIEWLLDHFMLASQGSWGRNDSFARQREHIEAAKGPAGGNKYANLNPKQLSVGSMITIITSNVSRTFHNFPIVVNSSADFYLSQPGVPNMSSGGVYFGNYVNWRLHLVAPYQYDMSTEAYPQTMKDIGSKQLTYTESYPMTGKPKCGDTYGF